MGICMSQPEPRGEPPKWASDIHELRELREKKNPSIDYLYERPRTSNGCIGCTAFSYRYEPRQRQWYWSPYTEQEVSEERRWIPVQQETLPAGMPRDPKWIGFKPHPCNLEIMRYLAQYNPDPSGGAAAGVAVIQGDSALALGDFLRTRNLGHLEVVLASAGFTSGQALKGVASTREEFMAAMESVGVTVQGDRAELWALVVAVAA